MYDYALRELVRRKKRTIVNIFGYAAAVAFLSTILTILIHTEDTSSSILKGTGTHFIGFVPLCGDEACSNKIIDEENEGFYAGTTRTKLLDNSLLQSIAELEQVAAASPFLLFQLKDKSKKAGSITLGGLPPGNSAATANNSCSPLDVIEGRFLSPADNRSVIVEASFAAANYIANNHTIRIAGTDFTVVGIIDSGIKPAKADVYLPLAAAKQIINSRVLVPLEDVSSMFLVESQNAKVHKQAIRMVKKIIGAGALISSYNCYEPASKVMTINRGSTLLITIVVYVSILAFALISQFSAVVERKRDIGILTSIGWSKGNIIQMLLYEALFQAGGGWFIGCLSVLLIFTGRGLFLTYLNQVPFEVIMFPIVFLYTFILALTGGIIAGILPGLSAANRKSADCLRSL